MQLSCSLWKLIPAMLPLAAWAQSGTPCPRFAAGRAIAAPGNLWSRNGVLQVAFAYQTRTDANGNVLYCYTTASGAQSPTLHVHPGDQLKITLQNAVPPSASSTMGAMPVMSDMTAPSPIASTCTPATMTSASTNIHYHGTNTPPVCHQDIIKVGFFAIHV